MNLRWAKTRHPAVVEKIGRNGINHLAGLLSASIIFFVSRIRVFPLLNISEWFIPISLAPVKQAGEGSRAPCQWSPGPKDSCG